MPLAWMPLFIAAAVASVANESPRIVVEGYGSVDTPANLARLSYYVLGEGKSSDEAVKDLAAKAAAIEGAVKAIDPQIRVQSDEMRIEGVRGENCKEDRYEEALRLSTGACSIVGYVAKQDFQIRTNRVDDAGTLVGLAGRQGATNPKIDSFQLADQRPARERAIAVALADARMKAQAIAGNSNATLGQMMSVSLDGAAITVIGQEEFSLRQSNVAEEVLRTAPVRIIVKPGPIETTARVTVSYALNP